MPGVIYRVLSKTTYDFGSVPLSSSTTYTVAKAIDVSAYREATALVRIHGLSINANTPAINVSIQAEAPTSEDPANDFIAAGNVALTGSIVLSSAYSTPTLTLVSIATTFGGFLRVKVQGIQGGTASSTFLVTLSVDIVAKS